MARKTPGRRGMIAFFCLVWLCMTPVSASAPVVFVAKSIGESLTAITVSGAGLPEMRGITFTCGYSVPHAAIMNAIVSSPQPKTALSVTVDTAAASLSIAVRAASTILISNGATILTITLNGASIQEWPLTVLKAIVVDKQGVTSQLPISLAAALVQNSGPFAANAEDRSRAQWIETSLKFFDVRGRKIPGSKQGRAPGYYPRCLDQTGAKSHFLIR